MSFIHIQGTELGHANFTGPHTVTLSTPPVAGNLVCCAITMGSSVTGLTVQDAAPNIYTVTPLSGTVTNGAGFVWFAYLLSAPANATAAVTASWTGSSEISMWLEEFQPVSGTAAFDRESPATGSGTTIAAPSIFATPHALLWATCASNASGGISDPVAGASAGPWTGAAGGIDPVSGADSEYILDASLGYSGNFTQSPSDLWNAMAMSFRFIPSTPQAISTNIARILP
jgi:hypothetical protein